MNQLKNLLEVLHNHSNKQSLETEDAFLAGLTLGNLLTPQADTKLA